MTTSCRRFTIVLVSAVTSTSSLLLAQPALPPPPAGVQVMSRYGKEFVAIGHPGNRNANQSEVPEYYPPFAVTPRQVGAVGRPYLIARTEVTASQWLEFVTAYTPFYSGSPLNGGFASEYIRPTSLNPADPLRFELVNPAVADYPVEVSWRWAAAYVNWLDSRRGSRLQDFESGVYDLSNVPPGAIAPNIPARNPGASVWLPSESEWVKAAYYDPNRYGPGVEGYWRHPNGSNTPLVPGLPGVGQTSASVRSPDGPIQLPVASYPDVQTPSGLLDMSGSVAEWGGEPISASFLSDIVVRGSSILSGPPDLSDAIDRGGAASAWQRFGIRLAAVIPSPASGVFVLAFTLLGSRRLRREKSMAADRHPLCDSRRRHDRT